MQNSTMRLGVTLLMFCATGAYAAGNASNPLAAVSNLDIRGQYLDLGGGAETNDYFVDGAFMVNPKLKVKYELHYVDTDVTGRSESEFESALIKLIYFPAQGELAGGTRYRVAIGFDVIADFDNRDKGIGTGADQIAPFVGVALGLKSGWMIIPLFQHFYGFSGEDWNVTAARVIALKPLPNAWWLKLDVKLPYNWEAETVPAEAEIQIGKNVSDKLALYIDGLVGIGDDRIYDWGLGLGIRFKF